MERTELFDTHKHLIPKLASKYMRYGKEGMEYDDLLQEAGLGLHLATRDFKPEKWQGKTFESYAVTRMYQSMMEFYLLSNKFYTPRGTVALASKIKRFNLVGCSISEISRKLGKSEKAIENALEHLKGVHFVGIDEPIKYKSVPRTLADILPDDSNICLAEHAALEMFIDTLSERDKAIFMMILQEKTGREIGAVMGFNASRAGHLKQRIRNKFSEFMSEI